MEYFIAAFSCADLNGTIDGNSLAVTGQDPINPYQTPRHLAEFHGNRPAGNPLMIPAITLIVLAGLTLALLLATMPGQIIRMRKIDTTTAEGQGELAGSIAALVGWVTVTLGIVWGSVAMLQLHGYRNAMAAAVLALIPICSPCFVLGIPFGIWAIVLLLRADVRARFQS